MKRLRGLIAFLFIISIRSAFAEAIEMDQNPRSVVHLLEYLSKDYAGAVKDGKILSQQEYAEQVEFAGYIKNLNAKLIPEFPDLKNLNADIETLNKLIAKKSSAEKVSALALNLKSQVIRIVKMPIAPLQTPNLQKGRQIFEAQCGSCHGVNGAGDGPLAKSLDPAPRNLQDDDYMEEVAPFHAFNVIRLGIPGTAMVPQKNLSDQEAWDTAFYALSIRHRAKDFLHRKDLDDKIKVVSLQDRSRLSDRELADSLKSTIADEKDRKLAVAQIRLEDPSSKEGGSGGELRTAKENLKASLDLAKQNKFDQARALALKAYLEGFELAEPQLKSLNMDLMTRTEAAMQTFRSLIEKHAASSELEDHFSKTIELLDQSEQILQDQKTSDALTFGLAFGILLREGFEAALILIAILGVIQATGATRARRYVHAGWLIASALGLVAWFFSSWLLHLSGAHREMSEAIGSLLAVAVLLYMGFWLHSRSEIHRWKAFLDGKVKSALEGSSRWGLLGLAFIAVFREAIESVLFLRAIDLQGGEAQRHALVLGVAAAFITVILLAWAFLRFSVKVPIRKLFSISAFVMMLLSVILIGKGLHSIQEAGHLSHTPLHWGLSFPLLGVYNSVETSVAQALMILFTLSLWWWSSRPQSTTQSLA